MAWLMRLKSVKFLVSIDKIFILMVYIGIEIILNLITGGNHLALAVPKHTLNFEVVLIY